MTKGAKVPAAGTQRVSGRIPTAQAAPDHRGRRPEGIERYSIRLPDLQRIGDVGTPDNQAIKPLDRGYIKSMAWEGIPLRPAITEAKRNVA